MLKNAIICLIVTLFVASSVAPITTGYNSTDPEMENMEILNQHIKFNCCSNYCSSNASDEKAFQGLYLSCILQEDNDHGSAHSCQSCSTSHNGSNYFSTNCSGVIDSPWPMKCHDNRHTGLSPYNAKNNNGAEKWRFKTDGWIESGAVIDDEGTIYFGCFDDYLYALYPNGTLKWKYKAGWIWSTPALDSDGTIYVGTFDDYLFAINPDGTLKWKFPAGGSISSSPAIADDGTIYFGTLRGFDKGDVIAVNPDGKIKWRYTTDYYVNSDPAIGDDGTIYIGSGDNYLYALNPDGKLKWKFKTGDWVKSHPSIAEDGTIYVSSFDLFLYALYPNGTMKWKFDGSYGGASSASIDKDGTIYVGGKDQLLAINPDGTKKWSVNLGDGVGHSSPAVSADGIIFVGADKSKSIFAINRDGILLWSKIIASDWVESSPCIGKDGAVYIGSTFFNATSSCSYLYAFGAGETNFPPYKPSIVGQKYGESGKTYNYTFVSIDPEEDNVSYYIEWGDGTIDDWIGPYPSGNQIELSHSWSNKGAFTIKAKAKDDYFSESEWSSLEVKMPKDIPFNSLWQILSHLIDRFPLLAYLFNY